MNRKLAKTLIFLAGSVVGAVISAVVTKKVVGKVYWDECDKELNEASIKHKDQLKALRAENDELKETISRQNVCIQTLNDKLAGKIVGNEGDESSGKESDDAEADRSDYIRSEKEPEKEVAQGQQKKYRAYRSRYGASEVAEDDSDYISEEEVEAEEQEIKEKGPYLVTAEEVVQSDMDYALEELRYFIYDGKVLNEDGEWLDNYAVFIGDKWLEGEAVNGMFKYVRNDYYCTDYQIEFIAGFGEEHMSVVDNWEDD